jgi:hypothetical protein
VSRWWHGGRWQAASRVALLAFLCVFVACGRAPAPSPSSRPNAAATPGPVININSAILGGSVRAFDAALGHTNCCLNNGWAYWGPFGPTWTGVYTEQSAFSWRSTARVVGVVTLPAEGGTTWTSDQVRAMQRQFMPPDAVLKSSRTTSLGDLLTGVETTYSSRMLAQTLPATDFKDMSGHVVPPGTFYVYWHHAIYGTEPSQYDQCAVGTHEQFALNPLSDDTASGTAKAP